MIDGESEGGDCKEISKEIHSIR